VSAVRTLALIWAVSAAAALPARAVEARYESGRAILEVEDGALSPSAAEGFARQLGQGIADIESYLGPAAAGGLREGPIVYRVAESMAFSNTRGRTVTLMAERVRAGSAPYLHETVHVLVPSGNGAVWLREGFANYVESDVAETIGGYDSHVFTRSGNRGVDKEAAGWLARADGRDVLPWVGATGQPPGMEEDRRGVAAPFYVLSQSLTKFLVAQVGLARVLALVSSRDPLADLERASGRSAEGWKAQWLERIGVRPTS
jgi:hypothetical protein